MKKQIDRRNYIKNHEMSQGGEIYENIHFLIQYFHEKDNPSEILCESVVIAIDADDVEHRKYGYFIVDEQLNKLSELGSRDESIFNESEQNIFEFEY